MARKTRNVTAFRFLARIGFAVNGLLHALIGLIAIGLARGGPSDDADQSGALKQLAGSPGGVITLWAVTIGLAALGVWMIIEAFLMPTRGKRRRAKHIAVEGSKGLAYLFLSGSALIFALGGTINSARDSQTASARLLSAPGGVLVIALLGVLVFGIGVYFVVKGVLRRFTEDIEVPSGAAGTAVTTLGVFGYAAKGLALLIVGVLFGIAAAFVDPSKATGLDGALRALTEFPLGEVALCVFGAVLMAYGVYWFARARHERL